MLAEAEGVEADSVPLLSATFLDGGFYHYSVRTAEESVLGIK